MKRIVCFIGKLLHIVCFIFFLLIFAMSMYAVFDSAHIYQKAASYGKERKPAVMNEEEETDDAVMPAYTRLIIENTDIDYPVMQGEDNEEYLDKDPNGSFSMSGSIFLDYRNKADFSDPYSIIYGHHMDGQCMFGVLDRYYDADYFLSHQNGKLIIHDQEQPLHIFALAVENAADPVFYQPGTAGREQLLTRIQNDALIYKEGIPEDGRIVALSTCRSYGYSLERTIVFAWTGGSL